MYIYELLDQFADYTFEEKLHKYTFKGKPVQNSVTQLISQFTPKFDTEYWSAKKAADLHKTQDEIKAEWKLKADISTNTGTIFHAYLEHMLSGKVYPAIDTTDALDSSIRENVHNRTVALLPLADKFLADTRHKLIPIKSELIIGNEDKVAGQIDQLFYNTASRKVEVWDWKTNKAINTYNIYKETLLGPLKHLAACEYTEYSLQLNIYKSILIQHGFDIGDCYFVWFNEHNSNYQCFKCLDLQAEVAGLLYYYS